MDETIIHNFGVPLKIEDGFYNSNLVWYLVNELHMPSSNVKWKIITKKALKPDTFRNFLLYIFKIFPEAQAKLLTNTFIEELGRKYSRSDHSFTCKDIDTAQCIWTSCLAEGKNATIDNYKDLFLIREQTVERIFSDNTSINRFVISQALRKCIHAFNKSERHLEFSMNDVIRGKIILHVAKMATKDESSVDDDFAVCSYKKESFYSISGGTFFLYNVQSLWVCYRNFRAFVRRYSWIDDIAGSARALGYTVYWGI